MALVSLDDLLPIARKQKKGIPAFNVVSLEMIISAVKAAEAEQSPIIIEYTEGDDSRIPLEYIGQFASQLAEKSNVPICVHLDHGMTLGAIMRAIKSGYSSVMYDGSALKFEENIKNTKEIVKISRTIGVSVEAELGRIETGFDNYTDPAVVHEFTSKTNISALAVSIGTTHGVYTGEPAIDYDRLEEINRQTTAPLVLHGGSGLEENVYKEVINRGISKINYYSAMSNDIMKRISNDLSDEKIYSQVYLQDAIDLELKYFKEEMRKVIRLFNK